jgi:hypothetical protein
MRWPKLKIPKMPPWAWVLGVMLFLEGGRKQLEEKVTQSGGGEQVPAVLTPTNASSVANAIVLALKIMGRDVSRQESWLYPLAVSQFETDVPTRNWRQLYNHNVGNVTASANVAGKWYLNPHVTTGLRFRSYSSLVSGAKAMLQAMQHAGALDAADKGDLPGFLRAMDSYNKGYAALDLAPIVRALRGTIVADVT